MGTTPRPAGVSTAAVSLTASFTGISAATPTFKPSTTAGGQANPTCRPAGSTGLTTAAAKPICPTSKVSRPTPETDFATAGTTTKV